MIHEFPTLPYACDASEPHRNACAMEIPHRRHHAAYVHNLNVALKKHSERRRKNPNALRSATTAAGTGTTAPSDRG